MITFMAVAAIVALLMLRSRSLVRELKMKQISKELKAQAAKHGLNIDANLIRNSWGLGIDKEQSLLLYVQGKRELKSVIFDLNKIDSCDILKTYTSPRLSFPSQKKGKKYIDRILLQIKHNGHSDDCHIAFYSHADDRMTEMKMLFEKARHWQRMILR